MARTNPIEEYLSVVDDIYGLFIDTNLATRKYRDQFIQTQKQSSTQFNIPISELDKLPNQYGRGNPNESCYILHECTQGELKERTKKDGKNICIIGNLSICQLFNYWEDHYRSEIAEYLKMDKSDLKADIFGDLRLYRQSIIHKRGVATSDIERCKVLLWFKHNDVIEIDSNKMEEIIWRIKLCLKSLGEV